MTAKVGVTQTTPGSVDEGYGSASAISGNGLVVAIGCPKYIHGGSEKGGVRIYDRDPATNLLTLRSVVVVANDAGTSDQFGFAVALNFTGDILAVSAVHWDAAVSGSNHGGVYLFDYSGTNYIQRSAMITYSPNASLAVAFALSLALNNIGNRIFIQGGYSKVGSNPNYSSSVLIFDWNGTSWNLHSQITSPLPVLNGLFGIGLAVSGDGTTLLCSERSTIDGTLNAGALFFFVLDTVSNSYKVLTTLYNQDVSRPYYANRIGLSKDGKFAAVLDYPDKLELYSVSGGKGLTKIGLIENILSVTGNAMTGGISFNESGSVLLLSGTADVAFTSSGNATLFALSKVALTITKDSVDTIGFVADIVDSVTGLRLNGGPVVSGIHEFVTGVESPISVTVRPDLGQVWQSAAGYQVGDKVFPDPVGNVNYFYSCTTAGTSGASEPTWATVVGDTFSDNTITWICVDNIEQPITQYPLLPSI